MHDMTARPVVPSPVGPSPAFTRNHRRFPTTAWMRKEAKRHVPLFAFEYGDTGAGNDVGILDNWSAFDAVKIVPRRCRRTRTRTAAHGAPLPCASRPWSESGGDCA